ncbi:MAG: anhydro-N-acetylmuramic acid kinase [Planctomycetes bacterium]|nr:anhydro-N-acetylmuramic acid kinase [Planctomycetota bacterium]
MAGGGGGRVVVGLMSGTSMDGVDAAVCRVRGSGAGARLDLLGFLGRPHPRRLRERLRALAEGTTTAREVCALHHEVGEAFAAAAEAALAAAGVRADLVGSHGQTAWHEPGRGRRPTRTLQVGEPSLLAERLGCPVVSDFRPRDCAAGGQGAPLVPYADWVIFRAPGRVRAVQNLGGIGNATVVTEDLAGVFAFDTGPANLPLDEAVRALTGGRRALDRDGRFARRGKVDRPLLASLLRHPFLRRRPPRSSGREEFGGRFVAEVRRRRPRLPPEDLLATLTAFSAAATVDAYRRWILPRTPLDEVLLSGGGARNPVLVSLLRQGLAPIPVRTTDEAGFPGAAREAAAFALLASEAFDGVPCSVPAATGARHAVVLGKVTR